jgi:hypothetical protein
MRPSRLRANESKRSLSRAAFRDARPVSTQRRVRTNRVIISSALKTTGLFKCPPTALLPTMNRVRGLNSLLLASQQKVHQIIHAPE